MQFSAQNPLIYRIRLQFMYISAVAGKFIAITQKEDETHTLTHIHTKRATSKPLLGWLVGLRSSTAGVQLSRSAAPAEPISEDDTPLRRQ